MPQRVTQRDLVRVIPEHEGAAEVGLPLFEDRPQIEVGDVVVGHHAIRRVGVKRQLGVLPGADHALVPVPRHAEHVGGQIPDLVGQLALADARADHAAALDLVEQCDGSGLSVEETLDTNRFGLARGGHTGDAIRLP